MTAADDHAMDEFFNALFLAGQRKDYVHHGGEMYGVGSIRVQLEGSRVLVMALLSDVKKFLASDNSEEVWRIKSDMF